MPISLLSVFIGVIVLNHIGVLRLAAKDELGERALTHAPLCSGLLTSITLVISMTLLTLLKPYAEITPALRVLDHFIYLIVMALTAHVLCAICYKLKPVAIIPALFPIMLMNSIGLGVIVLKINEGAACVLAISAVFIITSTLFYHVHLWFNKSETPADTQRLSILLLLASLFSLLLSGLITFY